MECLLSVTCTALTFTKCGRSHCAYILHIERVEGAVCVLPTLKSSTLQLSHLPNHHGLVNTSRSLSRKRQGNSTTVSGGYLSTYRAYKDSTDRLVSWIAQAAKQCGTKDVNLSKQVLPLKDFVGLAKAVADSAVPKIRFPAKIITLTKSVIGLQT